MSRVQLLPSSALCEIALSSTAFLDLLSFCCYAICTPVHLPISIFSPELDWHTFASIRHGKMVGDRRCPCDHSRRMRMCRLRNALLIKRIPSLCSLSNVTQAAPDPTATASVHPEVPRDELCSEADQDILLTRPLPSPSPNFHLSLSIPIP